MDERNAETIFNDFLRKKEVEIDTPLAQVPRSTKRLSTGWALYYQSQAYLNGQFEAQLIGHGPVVISDEGLILEGGSLDVGEEEGLLQSGKPFVLRVREGR